MGLKNIFGKSKVNGESTVLLVLMLTGCAAVLYYAKDRASDGATVWFMAVIGMAAVFYCYKGSELSCHAWYQRRAVKFATSAMLLVAAFTIEAVNHLSVGSKNQDELSAARMSQVVARDDAEAAYNSAKQTRAAREKRVTDLEGASSFNETATGKVNGLEVTTADAAMQMIEKAKAHRFWGVTDGCKETKGPETRKFCEEYRSAEAAKAMANERVRKGADLKSELTEAKTLLRQAEDELKAAIAAKSKTSLVTSKERADTRNLRKVANKLGFEEVDDNLLMSLLFVLGLTSFIAIRKWQMTAELYEDMPKKPWGVVAFFKKLWLGSPDTHAAPASSFECIGSSDPLAAAQLALKQGAPWAAAS